MKVRLEQLRIVHRTLAHTKLEAPSAMFTEKVMKNLHVSPPQSSSRHAMVVPPRRGDRGCRDPHGDHGLRHFDGFKETLPLNGTTQLQKYIQPSLQQISIDGRMIIKILVGLNLALAL